MRCQKCDYPLWNLKARECPECGTVFKPSDADFLVNSVQFCCPHCDQAYYGTDERGHLTPRSFECVNCHQQIDMDEMVLRPAEGMEEEQTQTDQLPWLRREKEGRLRSWFSMIGLAMTNPHRVMRSLPPESSVGQAWWFAAVTWLVLWFGGVGLPFVAIGVIMAITRNRDFIEPTLVGLGMMLGGVCWSLLCIAIWGLIAQGLLMVTGGSSFTIGRTYEALCYSAGCNAVLAIPCLGPYCGSWVGAIWWVVSATLMVMVGQRVSGPRASLAVVTAPAVASLLGLAGYFGWVFLMVSGRGGFMNQVGAAVQMEPAAAAVADYAAGHEGRGPEHAALLVSEGLLGPAFFIGDNSVTNEADIPVGDTTLEGLQQLPPGRRHIEVQKAIDALPPDVIAHRLGDIVFTYHGIDLNSGDPDLWILILSPDPDVGNALGSEVPFSIGQVQGMTMVTNDDFATLLKRQNELRATFDLPPLPDPATVTHARPATAGGATSPAPE